jgi:hypothetical protein
MADEIEDKLVCPVCRNELTDGENCKQDGMAGVSLSAYLASRDPNLPRHERKVLPRTHRKQIGPTDTF